jgi:dipeptide transport system permease protein
MTHSSSSAKEVSPGLQRVQDFIFGYISNKGAVVGFCVMVALVVVAIFAPWLAPHPPGQQFRDAILLPPAWMAGGNPAYLLGTDPIGRDMLSRLIFGTRYSLYVGSLVVCIAMVGGVAIGMIAGYVGGWLDTIIMRIMDVIQAFPSLLLALVLVAILGPGLTNAMIAIAIVLQPHFARLARAAVMTEKGKEYVTAVRVGSGGPLRLMFLTILPNCLSPLVVQATLSFSTAILDAAALGFLGMGAQPPTPEWGTMLAEAREFILRAWWVVTFPGIAILTTVLSINLIGDGLRDTLDPKLRKG